MHIRYIIGLLWVCFVCEISSFVFNSKPICKVYTPDSILLHKADYKPLALGGRMRYATCTGAAWFHGTYLAVLNLFGEHMTIYAFDEERNEFTIIQHITNQQGARFSHAEQVCVSPDGTLLVVVDARIATINVYSIDLESHLINPSPMFVLTVRGLIHNARFTSDGRYFAYGSFYNKESVGIYKVMRNQGTVNFERVYTRSHTYPLVSVKGVNFTQDSRYIVLAYAPSARTADRILNAGKPLESLLVVHKFNQNGSVGAIVCFVTVPGSIEDIAFLDNDHVIVASDQYHDILHVYPFDAKTGQIASAYTSIQNPDAQLSFPHGMSVSHDGKYLVVTNFGDDTFNLYRID